MSAPPSVSRHRPRLLAVAVAFALATALAVAVIDQPLAAWIHRHGRGLGPFWLALTDGFDAISGLAILDFSRYFAAIVFVVAGVVAAAVGARAPALAACALPLWTVAIVHLASRLTVNPLKTAFGRLRPLPWIAQGEPAATFFAHGPSFPSGHVAYYLSLCLPLALAFPRWRVAFLAVPVIIGAARVGAEQHFLGDTLAAAAWVTFLMWGIEALLRRVRR
jgi:membrane-associated phospholipid phosphatase